MAEAYPQSSFTCIDYDEPSIECAKANAQEAGVSNVEFQVATSKEFDGSFDVSQKKQLTIVMAIAPPQMRTHTRNTK